MWDEVDLQRLQQATGLQLQDLTLKQLARHYRVTAARPDPQTAGQTLQTNDTWHRGDQRAAPPVCEIESRIDYVIL